MKIGILLILVGLFMVYSIFDAYYNDGDMNSAALCIIFIGFPCFYFGNKRIKRHNARKNDNS